jgi:tRNA(adenine34) deaminase
MYRDGHTDATPADAARVEETGGPAAIAEDERYMRLALEEARRAADYGEVPIGAVIVRDGQVLARAHNWRETWRDPTAHAEVLAIREAARRLGGWRLEGCDLYVTLEPCPMCAGAIVQARIRRLVYGAADPKAGAVASRTELLVPGRWNHHPQITAGILATECGNILKDFFRSLRSRRATGNAEEDGATGDDSERCPSG